MKKIMILLIVLLFVGCSKEKNVDLSNITCDGISIGDDFDTIDVTKYTTSDRFPTKENTYDYSEWRISTNDNNEIQWIHANFDSISVSINSVLCKSIDEIKNTLGENYKDSKYDRSQQLNQLVYRDMNHKLKVTFIYSSVIQELVWAIIERTE